MINTVPYSVPVWRLAYFTTSLISTTAQNFHWFIFITSIESTGNYWSLGIEITTGHKFDSPMYIIFITLASLVDNTYDITMPFHQSHHHLHTSAIIIDFAWYGWIIIINWWDTAIIFFFRHSRHARNLHCAGKVRLMIADEARHQLAFTS